jgi:hypothetical protein
MAPWVVTCSCGWTQEYSQRWAAESVAKLNPKLGEADSAGVGGVTIIITTGAKRTM